MSRWSERAALGLIALLLMAGHAIAAGPDLAERLRHLVAAYPDTIAGVEGNQLLLRDGGPPLVIDDRGEKSHAAALARGDIEDSLVQLYPPGACSTTPEVNVDPGRIRSDALMMRLYGSSAKAVEADLVPVKWFGETLRVTRRHGVAEALGRVRDRLAAQPGLTVYLTPSAGTFNWRKVAGASNMSVHSFGAAVDINTKHADYWVWSGGKPGRVGKYVNKYPLEIVDAFEREGFIWGGRWYHYDTMHFEYRPELIAIAKAAGVSACR